MSQPNETQPDEPTPRLAPVSTPLNPTTIEPFKALRHIGFVLAGALIFGVFLPGTVAILTENYYPTEVEKHLGAEDATRLAEFKERQNKREQEIARIDAVLLRASQSQSQDQWQYLEFLLKVREHLKGEMKAPPPLYVSGYYLDYTMPLWPLIYMCLGLLAFLLKPRNLLGSRELNKRKAFGATACIFICIFVIQRMSTWWRNSPLGRVGRTVYSNVNIDISRIGFFTQEFMAAVTCLLLAIIWCQWLAAFVWRYKELSRPGDDSLAAAFDSDRLRRLSITFVHWQLASLVLSAGFVYYTFFFWRAVAGDGDVRYVVAAIIVHVLWGVTWAIISLPLIITWYNWSELKTRALTVLGQSKDMTSEQVKQRMAILLEIKPIPTWSLAGSSVGAFTAFVWPIVQAFWKH